MRPIEPMPSCPVPAISRSLCSDVERSSLRQSWGVIGCGGGLYLNAMRTSATAPSRTDAEARSPPASTRRCRSRERANARRLGGIPRAPSTTSHVYRAVAQQRHRRPVKSEGRPDDASDRPSLRALFEGEFARSRGDRRRVHRHRHHRTPPLGRLHHLLRGRRVHHHHHRRLRPADGPR